MKIGFDASRLAVSARTGTEHYSWELLNALGQIDQEHNYVLYCNTVPAALPPLPPSYVLQPMPWRRGWTHGRLSLEMLLRSPDVLFVPAHALPIVPAARSVVTIHDLGFLYYPKAHTRSQQLYHRIFTRLSAQRASHIIAISEATKRDLQHFYGIPDSKISVIYHGVDPRFKPIDDGAMIAGVLQRFNIDTPYILFVSTVQPRKNVARLIEAFALVRHQHNIGSLRLVLAGKRGWLTESIERRAAELGIDQAVQFIGYVPDEDLPPLLNGALAYVAPSLYEGFGMTILEAQACGTPVIASNASSLPEVVGDAGILVDPHDVAAWAAQIAAVVRSANLRQHLRERGLQHAAAWTWERTARQTLDVLQHVGRS